ncbi:Gfo/Idh/MocA family protein [Microbacterium sp. A204]|uniref:Gfo/Idh/MocA family protein n=1 Tax=Microbacterium sp. A204 TaxID=3457321 RepID=UPI003FD23D47
MDLVAADLTDLRVGVIGAGEISHDHVRGWLELGAQVTAYSRSGAAALVHDYGLAEVDSLDELLRVSDVVDICTPTTTHPDLVRAALEARVPIICEKPLALTADAAQDLVDEAREAGIPLYPAHVVRFMDDYSAAKRAVDDGEIGAASIARFRRSGAFPTWGSWFADEQQSGGIVLDQMIHDIDFAGWVCGPVVSVCGMRSAPVPGSPAVSAQLQLQHEGGAISYVTGIWGAPGLEFSTRFSIAGDAGVLRHDSRDSAEGESPYTTQLRELARAITGEGTSRVSGADGVEAVRVARAAIETIAAERVEIPDAMLTASVPVHESLGRIIAISGVCGPGPSQNVFDPVAEFVDEIALQTQEYPVRVFATQSKIVDAAIVSIHYSGGMITTLSCSTQDAAGEMMLELVGTEGNASISADDRGHRTTRRAAACDVVRAAQESAHTGRPVDLSMR